MNHLDLTIDFYSLLDCNLGSEKKEIIKNYREKINKFSGKKLTNDEKKEIKNLKLAKFILLDDDLREKYNITYLLDDDENDLENEFENNDVPLRKDKKINYSELSDRNFTRFTNDGLDLEKERKILGFTRKDKHE
jgi:curved DNA-binding protein CbpA